MSKKGQNISLGHSYTIKTAFSLGMLMCFSPYITAPIALVIGFMFAYFFGHPFQNINHHSISWLLKIAVVGIGFGMNMQEAIKVSGEGFLLTISSIFIILILGYFVGKSLGIQRKSVHLISVGTAICGGSAIAAIAPIIDSKEKDMSISLGVVFLLNSLALLLFPLIGSLLQLSEYEFGLWSAIAIHDTSSVVGAASSYGNHALEVATTVKMARVLWIIPLSVFSMIIFRGENKKIKIPWFIVFFILAILYNSYYPLDSLTTNIITGSAKKLLILALYLIGAGLTIDKIKTAGWKPMVLGFTLWIVISVFSLLYILE